MVKTKRAKATAAAAQKKKHARAVKSIAGSARSEARIEVVRESRPRRKVNPAEVLDERHTGITYSSGRSNPYSTYFGGILANPDPVSAKVGGGNVSFYEDMLIAHSWLAGICDQRVEKASKERVIVAGDPSVPRSVEMANIARRKWRVVRDKPTVLARWLRNGRFLGYGGLEKVFSRDADGIVYVARVIARDSTSIRFRDDGTALWLSLASPFTGEEIPRRKMSFITGGTNNTSYGFPELANVYTAVHLIEKAMELAFDSVEEFGRPIPKLKMPRAEAALKPGEREQLRAYCRAVHSRFVELPTTDANPDIEMMNAPLASSGQTSRPEMALIDMLVTWCYIRILRIAQTLNTTGGSRSLEEVRYEITSDASRPDCILLDDALNAITVVGDEYTGWMADFNDFNFPDAPEEILPRFETPTLAREDIQAHHDRAMDMIDRGLGADLSKDQYLSVTGQEKAKHDDDRLGGEPLTRVTRTEQEEVGSSSKRKPAPPQRQRQTDEPPLSLADVITSANALARQLDELAGIAP